MLTRAHATLSHGAPARPRWSQYFLSALKIRTWWRKHLTTIQLVQFATVFSQATLMWGSGPACGYPDFLKATMLAYQASMMALFGQFFLASYGAKGANSRPKAA